MSTGDQVYQAIFRPPAGIPPRPWTYEEMMYNGLLMIVAFMIIVTAIYLPWINDSSCVARVASWSGRESSFNKQNFLQYQPQESKASLTQFSRDLSGRESGQHGAVMILENMFTGLATLSIPQRPIYSIAKLAAESKSEDDGKTFTAVYKHRFPMVTMSGKQGTAEEIYMTVYMAQTLAKEKGVLILNGVMEDSPAFEALNLLVKDGILAWNPVDLFQKGDETWISAKFAAVNTAKSVSEYLYDIINRYLNLSDVPIKYYVISKEREDELRRAYKSDKTFKVENTTTAIHGAVLKVLFPDIKLTLPTPTHLSTSPSPSVSPAGVISTPVDVAITPVSLPRTEDEIYAQAIEFLNDYIL